MVKPEEFPGKSQVAQRTAGKNLTGYPGSQIE
jgi:hypothetical protein